MNRMHLVKGFLCLSLTFGIATAGLAGEPQDQLKGTTDKVLSILANPDLKGPGKAKERRELIRKTIDEHFDWEEMARRSLARHWVQRTPEEKREFIPLFRELLERVYADKVEGYSWNKILYEEERIDGDYAGIKIKIFTAKDQIIQVEYRTWKKGNSWLVYDFSVEGVSLVNNYRTQFNEIIAKSSYQELVKRLKAKSTQN
ncbi:MAG: ABC transporter substrate-binding protein [Thermodesulfobacteriota bacterium]|nr:ABC transporter substrate-binding protein [Thermodesulfobacteriota bacterium]